MHHCLTATAVLLLLATLLPDARAQNIRRCTASDGTTVFTDRRCDSVNAQPRLPPPTRTASANDRAIRKNCPQRLSQLVESIQHSVLQRDINGLSNLYWWAGTPSGSASEHLERLEAVLVRPLIAITPLYPQHTPPYTAPDVPAFLRDDDPPLSADSVNASRPPVRARPHALRLEQTLGNNRTPSQTVLHLQRHYGCFWITL